MASRLRKAATKTPENSSQFAVWSLNIAKTTDGILTVVSCDPRPHDGSPDPQIPYRRKISRDPRIQHLEGSKGPKENEGYV